MRELVDLAHREGLRLGLCWSGVKGAGAGLPVAIPDGSGGDHRLFAELSEPDLTRLLQRTREIVPASSPLLVFGDGDATLQASLEFPKACSVISARDRDPQIILSLLRHLLAEVETGPVEFALPSELLRECLSLRDSKPGERGILHFAGRGEDPGSKTLLRCLRNRAGPAHLRLVLSGASLDMERSWRRQLASIPGLTWELLCGAPEPMHFDGCAALVQPESHFSEWQPWVMAMASGRVLVASLHGASARLLNTPGICVPLGGRAVDGGFLVDPRCLDHALMRLMNEDPPKRAELRGIAERARSWVRMHLDPAQPAKRKGPHRIGRRPLVVRCSPYGQQTTGRQMEGI